MLSPASPSMEISLVTDNHVKKDCDETDSRNVPSGPLAPPSSLDMSVPPCRLTVSKTTLKYAACLQKSLPFGIEHARAAFPMLSFDA